MISQVKKPLVKRYFRLFSGVVLIISLLYLLGSYAELQMGGFTMKDFGKLSEVEQQNWYATAITVMIIDIFLTTVFLYLWITFLGLYLFDDKDYMRRRFLGGFIPLIISAAVTSVSVPMAIVSESGYYFFIGVLCLFFIIRVFYFLTSFWLLREYKRQNGYLRFFNPWVFFIPVAAGWLIQDLLMWDFSALGSALGVVLIFSWISGEQRYMDMETGFYNMDFTGYLKELIGKNEYAPCSAMTFTLDSAEKMNGFSEILKKQLPMSCEPILHNDREIVVLTNVRERGPLTMVMEDVKEASDIMGTCTLKKKGETAKEFMERVL